MDEERQPAETQGTTPPPEGGPKAQDDTQPQEAGQEALLAEAEDTEVPLSLPTFARRRFGSATGGLLPAHI